MSHRLTAATRASRLSRRHGRPTDRRAPESRRQLLVALNACLELSRDAVCRLALDPSSWLADEPDPASGLRRAHLSLARSVAAEAAAAARREQEAAARHGARIVTRLDADYPSALNDLELPPPVLYVKGVLPQGPALAMVGSRRADPYGLEAAGLFASALAEAGLTIVSGLALGIDSAAHRGALSATDGRTVAVQGRGIDAVYPQRNRRLGEEIARRGALVSEFPVGTLPLARNFPVRNRIIAALGSAVLVVQAAARSGSLITARMALDLGRDVFAIPGAIFDARATGTNALLADGALLAQRPRDVLEALPLAVRDHLDPGQPLADTGDEPDPLCALLTEHHALSPEQLATHLSRPVEEIMVQLLDLELSGRVRRHPGPVFHLLRERL